MRRVLLCTPVEGEALDALVRVFPPEVEVLVVQSLEELERAHRGPDLTLICFGTGVVVPPNVLEELSKPAYNFHAAPPDFPGRDPHHFAAYAGVDRYGATAHLLTERVDAGPIVGVELVRVRRDCTHAELLAAGQGAAARLFRDLAPAMVESTPLPTVPGVSWGTRKTRRANFLAMCELPLTVSDHEFTRRFRSFDGGVPDNLRVVLHGHTFRIDKGARPVRPSAVWEDFTEDAYRRLLALLLERNYRTATFDAPVVGRHVYWRHDVDMSIHRAVRLAEMEANVGVTATYFLNPRSAFYSLLEPEILGLARRLSTLGHAIGLHFDASAFPPGPWTKSVLEQRLGAERALLTSVLECDVRAFSFHNPDVGELLRFDDDELAGMVNCYGRALRSGYKYASDSNGYWRFESIPAVLEGGHERLHILTHPEWWSPEPLPPRARVERCALGRAQAVMAAYDRFLTANKRENIDR